MQVDKVAFRETVIQPGLKERRDQIKELLGIDWTKVKWEQLRTPLYSALAARLYLARLKLPIPADLPSQAQYWKDHYNSHAKKAKGTVDKFIKDVNNAPECKN